MPSIEALRLHVRVTNVAQFERIVRELSPGLLELEENDRDAAMSALTRVVRVEVVRK